MDSWSLKVAMDNNDDVTVMVRLSMVWDCGLLQLVTRFWSVLKSMWSHQWGSQHLMENQYDELKENKVMTIDLDGKNGNAFYLLGTAQLLAKQCGLDDVMITEEMQSGDYMNLVKTMDKYFPFVVFETNSRIHGAFHGSRTRFRNDDVIDTNCKCRYRSNT